MKQSETQKRRDAIVTLVNQRGAMQVDTLARQFSTSEVTIRKDLSVLAEAGRLVRQLGGAAPLPGSANQRHINLVKQRIGEAAAALIGDNTKLAIDSGSTTEALIPHLSAHKQLIVMTNSLNIANALVNSPNDPSLLMTGGTWDPHSRSFQGAMAENTVAAYSFDIAFVGASGIDIDRGTTTLNELTGLSRAMAEGARQVVVMAESKKLNERMPNLELSWSQISVLVTDDGITEQQKKKIESQGVRVDIATRRGE
ncbi:DeoR/GlpR family DNA-binding transcription regulator [Alteromonas sp. CYL-A6]|uniref:DeoR/GlpR family DNA-binding transcription regulator n=1 Tax=Alteromonas nitratireducens TaxID=3390813 RepID=UPI0034BF8F27